MSLVFDIDLQTDLSRFKVDNSTWTRYHSSASSLIPCRSLKHSTKSSLNWWGKVIVISRTQLIQFCNYLSVVCRWSTIFSLSRSHFSLQTATTTRENWKLWDPNNNAAHSSTGVGVGGEVESEMCMKVNWARLNSNRKQFKFKWNTCDFSFSQYNVRYLYLQEFKDSKFSWCLISGKKVWIKNWSLCEDSTN